MIRKIAIFFSVVFALPLSSHALVGGPFDGGDYGQSLDDQGVYQAAFRLKNGVGYAQFGSNVAADLFTSSSSSGTGTSNTVRSTAFTVLNRSVVYYKGVTYLGSASGMVDLEQRTVTGITNGSSDVGTVGSINQSNNNNTQSISAASTTLVNNGSRGFVCNTGWEAHIIKTAPILKFRGTGELSVLNADGLQLINQAVTGLIQAIPTVAQNNGTIPSLIAGISSVTTPTVVAQVQAATTSNDSTFKSADIVKITVVGQRKFFNSLR